MKERVTISVDPKALETVRAEVASGKEPSLSAAIEGALIARKKATAMREAIALSGDGSLDEEAQEWAIKELRRAMREVSSSTPAR